MAVACPHGKRGLHNIHDTCADQVWNACTYDMSPPQAPIGVQTTSLIIEYFTSINPVCNGKKLKSVKSHTVIFPRPKQSAPDEAYKSRKGQNSK